MARARNIKPGLYKNEIFAGCSIWARYIFPGLWMLADREGRLEDRPTRIKAELFPYEEINVDPLLDELEGADFIQRYEIDGERYIQIHNFVKHQRPHVREQVSTIPPALKRAEKRVKAKPRLNQGSDKAVQGNSLGHAEASPGCPSSLNPSSLNPSSLIVKACAQPAEENPGETETPAPELPPVGGADSLFPESNEDEIPEIDDKAILFEMGTTALKRLGAPEKSARGMIGKALKEIGLEAAMRVVGRLNSVEKTPNAIGLMVELMKQEKDEIFIMLRDRYGECRYRPGGGYIAGSRTFGLDGSPEVAL